MHYVRSPVVQLFLPTAELFPQLLTTATGESPTIIQAQDKQCVATPSLLLKRSSRPVYQADDRHTMFSLAKYFYRQKPVQLGEGKRSTSNTDVKSLVGETMSGKSVVCMRLDVAG